MKMALYARVSTEDQLKGYSIEIQTEKLTQYAKLNDIENYELFVDEGQSAKSLNRPAVKEMLKRATSGEFNCIVIHKLDRLTRSLRDLQDLIELFDSHKLQLISLNENLDSKSANGRLHLNMLGSVSQWERETIQERVCLGVKQAVISGKFLGGICLGYKYDSTSEKEEAELVKTAFKMYVAGYGTPSISRFLLKKYPTILKEVNPTTISRMLKKRTYLGEYSITFSDGTTHINTDAFPQIIDEDLFNQVQEITKNRKVITPRNKGKRRIFTGYLFCELCGNPICGTSGKTLESIRYRCSHRYRSIRCQCGSFYEEEFEVTFVQYIINTLKEIGVGNMNLNVHYSQANTKNQLKNELKRLGVKRKKCYFAFENDLISKEDFTTRTLEFKKREEEILNEIDDLQEVAIPKIFEFKCDDFEKYWNSLDRPNKIEFVSTFIKEIKLSKGNYMPDRRAKPIIIHQITFA